MEIRKAKKEDWEGTAQFYDRVTAYLAQNINYPKWIPGEYPGKGSTHAAIEEGCQYLCVDGTRIVGAFILNENPQGDYCAGSWGLDLEEGEYLVIHTLAADPKAYRSGLGRYMVEACIKIAKEQGYKALRLDVVPDNVPARRLYEKMGFTYAGEKDLKRGIEAIPRFALYELRL